jgi:hypothetical protein
MTQSVHCAATLAAGRPCRAWAMHGHALCRSHRDDELGPRGAGAPRAVCGGAACGNHLCLPVLPGGPGRHRCRQNRLTHGFYSRHFTPEERASRRSRALPAGSGRPRQRGQPCLRDCRWRPQAPRALGGGGAWPSGASSPPWNPPRTFLRRKPRLPCAGSQAYAPKAPPALRGGIN